MGMSEPCYGRKRATRWPALLAVTILSVLGGPLAAPLAAEEFVAGTMPDRRPPAAPRINAFTQTPEWRARALSGVTKPVPPSLRFLDDQGAWFTPFTRPNMPPPYDIRGLYAATARPAPRAR